MHDADFLFTNAEVAVSLAGFASIVAAIGQRATRDNRRIDASRLRGLLECSLVVTAFSLIPYAVSRVVAAEPVAWRISSAAFAVTAALVTIGMLRRSRRLNLVVAVRVRVMVIGLYTAPIPLLALAALGLVGAEIYLFGLLSYLLAAGIAFLRVMLSFIEAIHTENEDTA